MANEKVYALYLFSLLHILEIFLGGTHLRMNFYLPTFDLSLDQFRQVINLFIMTSKITIEVDFQRNSPYIKIVNDISSNDVRDKLIKHISEKLEGISNLCSIRFGDLGFNGTHSFQTMEIYPIEPSKLQSTVIEILNSLDSVRIHSDEEITSKQNKSQFSYITNEYFLFKTEGGRSLLDLKKGILQSAINDLLQNSDNFIDKPTKV